jgi:YesN/AraC family two-component response regulator
MEAPRSRDAIRVVIADDHQVVRTGLERLLDGWPNVTVVGTAADGAEAVRLTSLHQPDVVLMDISMPLMGGLEATRKIVAAWPDV